MESLGQIVGLAVGGTFSIITLIVMLNSILLHSPRLPRLGGLSVWGDDAMDILQRR
jgi:hypothetical protein